MRSRVSFFAFLVLCLGATAVSAGPLMFGFTYNNIHATFDGVGSFGTTHWANTFADVYRNLEPAGTALFLPGLWSGPEGLALAMTIDNITATTAVGTGSFTITDVHGDSIAGDLSGTWVKVGNSGVFTGSMSNVVYTSLVDDFFDGHWGSASMSFPDRVEPWSGMLMQLNAGGGWFTDAKGTLRTFDVKGGSVDAMVNAPVIPAPGALALGVFGLIGAAGWKRRRFGTG